MFEVVLISAIIKLILNCITKPNPHLMKSFPSCIILSFFTLFLASCNSTDAQPTVEQFKQAFEVQMQKLTPEGFKRTIVFQNVVKGQANGGYYPFKVEGYVHDYSAGYPANHYYGQTCLGKIDGFTYEMHKDEFGKWIVQGRFTVTTNYKDCKDNPSQGAEAIPLANVPGTVYHASNTGSSATVTNANTNTTDNSASKLYIGEYASYGYGNRILAGMGFRLNNDGSYTDIDNKRGGRYVYDSKNATITFNGGFLDGEIGRNVKLTGFQLSNTVSCEPWR